MFVTAAESAKTVACDLSRGQRCTGSRRRDMLSQNAFDRMTCRATMFFPRTL